MTPDEYEGVCRNIAAGAGDDWLRSEVAAFDAEEREETVYIRILRAELAWRAPAAAPVTPVTPVAAPAIGPGDVQVTARTSCGKCGRPAEWDEDARGWRHTDVAEGVFCHAMHGET